jgi:hypothetical protein
VSAALGVRLGHLMGLTPVKEQKGILFFDAFDPIW